MNQDPAPQDARLRRKNLAIFCILISFVILIFVITIVKITLATKG